MFGRFFWVFMSQHFSLPPWTVQGNLKLGFGGGCRVSLPDFDFRGFEQYQHSQEKAWQRILEASYVASTPVAVKLGAPGLAHLPVSVVFTVHVEPHPRLLIPLMSCRGGGLGSSKS